MTDPAFVVTYQGILQVVAFMASWCAAMLTGLMFRSAL